MRLLKSIPQVPLVAPERRQSLHQRLNRLLRPAWLGTLRRTTPLSEHWGSDRGTPIDRYYIERFIEEHRNDIRGRVLEVRDSRYTDLFGCDVERQDVLDIEPKNQLATIVADLATADAISSSQFDCFLLIQTLQYIYETRAAIAHAHRILKPGGVLLGTVPAVSKTYAEYRDYWRFTADSCSLLLGEKFEREKVTIRPYGNVLTAMAFLTGMASEDLSRRELEFHDDAFPVIIAVRAVKQ